jgi:UDP-glucuronate 4-epimerase
MNRVLVTGAAGFIGSHLTDKLLKRGDHVIGLDNFDTLYPRAVKRRNLENAGISARFHLVEGDIRNAEGVSSVFDTYGPFDAVVHLAAKVGVRDSLLEPTVYDAVNVQGTTTLLDAARTHGTPRFIFGSSSSVYGATTPVPFLESFPCDRPSSPYAATKRAGEIACYAYHHLYDLDVTCLRFFTVYGPRQRPEMAIHRFARLIAQGLPLDLFGDGTSRRDYTYVEDIVAGVTAALDRATGYHIYNLGTSDTTSLSDLVSLLSELLDRPAIVRHEHDQPGDVPVTFADVSAAEHDLGFAAPTKLADGLRKFVDWFNTTREEAVGFESQPSSRRL